MFWIFLILIIVTVALVIRKEQNASVKNNVANYGGMKRKYNELIIYLGQGAKIDKVTKDSIRISSSSMIWILDVVGNDLEIRMNGFMPTLGHISHKWIYPHNFSQSKIIQDIENHISWQLERFQSNIKNNPTENLHFKS